MSTVRPEDIKTYILKRCNRSMGREEGLLFGDPYADIKGILVTWMATVEVIEEAAKKGCNFILCHEALLYPYVIPEGLKDVLCWRANARRIELLANNNITVFRAHGSLDHLLIAEYFGKMCKLRKTVAKEGFAYIYEIYPTTLREFAENVKQSLSLDRIRAVGNLERKISRIGLAVGGMGLSVNINFWKTFLKYNVDVILVGETDEYAIRYALDGDIAVVETTHPSSENAGLKKFSEDLAKDFHDIKVYFFDVGNRWHFL